MRFNMVSYRWASMPWQIFIVQEALSGRWSLRIMDQQGDSDSKLWSMWLRGYGEAADAVNAVKCHNTGHQRWDSYAGELNPPAEIEAWEGMGHTTSLAGDGDGHH